MRSASVTCSTRPTTVALQHATAFSPSTISFAAARYPSCLAYFLYALIMAKHSPNRRRSIATLGHGYSKSTTSHRRRAYSIAPGERLSPAAKARRLLVSSSCRVTASIQGIWLWGWNCEGIGRFMFAIGTAQSEASSCLLELKVPRSGLISQLLYTHSARCTR